MDRNEIDGYTERRSLMVEEQIAARGIRTEPVLAACGEVPRHIFVPRRFQDDAYKDHPLPIGGGQTISQPYIVAYMTEKLSVSDNHMVLEIGTGSGYQAAILSRLSKEVHTIETVEVLYKRARRVIESLGYGNIFCYLGDGYSGLGENTAFNRIIVTAAAPRIPETLVALLSPGGKMVLPVGQPHGYQELVLVERDDHEVRTQPLLGVRFVPMTGKIRRRI